MNRETAAHLALLAVALIYGANYTIAKVVMDDRYIGPLGFILTRVLAATALFWLFGRGGPAEAPRGADLRRLILCGFLGVAVNQMCFFTGLDRTTPIHAAMIMVLTPMLVLLLGALLQRRRLDLRVAFGVVLAGAGAAWLIGQGGGMGGGDVWGDILVAVNAISYALYLVMVRSLMHRYPAMWVLKWVFLFGACFVVFFGWEEVWAARWADFDWTITLSFAYVLVFTTFLAYGLNAYALRRVAPVTVSAYIYLQPVIAAAIAIGLGRDHLDGPTLASSALIFAGVWLSGREEGKASPEARKP